jgi:hypothetical protein
MYSVMMYISSPWPCGEKKKAYLHLEFIEEEEERGDDADLVPALSWDSVVGAF